MASYDSSVDLDGGERDQMLKRQNGQVKVVVLSVWLSCHEPLDVLVLYDTTKPQ
jgi:hypothetical protein